MGKGGEQTNLLKNKYKWPIDVGKPPASFLMKEIKTDNREMCCAVIRLTKKWKTVMP